MKYGMVTLSVAEAKRLIAKGTVALPQVRKAMERGTIIIAGGTTNGYVVEELAQLELDKARYTAGVICGGRCCITPAETRLEPMVLQQGKVVETSWTEALNEMGNGDIFIKGGNALDLDGNVGILLGSPTGGTIGAALGSLSARNIEMVTPIGLEKLVPSVFDAAALLGIGRLDYSRGIRCGMQVVPRATVVTEDVALTLLSGCDVTTAAKGGIGVSAGSTTLAFAGEDQEFNQAIAILDSVLGEAALAENSRKCPCHNPCHFGRPKSSR